MLSTLSKSSLGHASKQLRSYRVSRRLAATAAARAEKSADAVPQKKPLPESKSFCMNLFRGRATTEQIFPYPLELSEDRRETLQMILGPTEKFLEEVNDPFENDEKAAIPMEKLKQFAELGAFGAVVPEELEGAGLINTQMARLAEVVGSNDLGLGVVMGAHQSIGYKGILLFGTDAQKKKYLPDCGHRQESIRSKAVKSEDGKHYILNGEKIFISNGGFAEIFTVFAQTPVKQPDGSVKEKISAFVVERAFGGVTNGPPEKKMGIKGSNTAVVNFDNVKVPVENLLGEEGEGFKVAMNILNNGRFGIPAAMTGCMKHCIKKTIEQVNTRVTFGKKLIEFGNVQEKLADMILRHYVAESIVYMLASNMDKGVQDCQLEAAIGKVVTRTHGTSATRRSSSTAVWASCASRDWSASCATFASSASSKALTMLCVSSSRSLACRCEADHLHRAQLRLFQYAGKHLQQLAKDVKSGNLGTLLGEFKRRTFGDTGEDFSSEVHPSLKDAASSLNACIKEFGSTVETLLQKHRKGIVDRQYELIRVANAAIDIYSMAAVLSRASYVLEKGDAPHDLEIAQLFASQASKRALENLKVAKSPSDTQIKLISGIANAVSRNEAMIQKHPIDV
ncbi:Protein ACDH-12 a [Aphelenchoides avenae]|nr:Protein ACDH-12 a [Aphelenchus avenae]